MFTTNLQATTATGNFQRGNMLARGTRMGGGMGGSGFYPLIAFFGFLLFVLFIFITVRLIRLAKHRSENDGFGYRQHRHEMRQMHEGCQKHERNQRHESYEGENKPYQTSAKPWAQGKPDEAVEILRKRFAAGEIKKEEFEESLQILKG